MAITRTQIAKQLLAKGGRIGFRIGSDEGDVSGREYGGSSKGNQNTGGSGNRDGRDPMAQFKSVRPTNPVDEVALTSSANRNFIRDARDAVTPIGDRLFSKVPFSGGIVGSLAKGALNLFSPSPFGYSSPTPVDFSGMDRGGDVPLWAQLGFSSEAEYLAALARASGETEQVVKGDSTEEKLFDERFRRFRANGGRIGFFKGAQADASAGKGAMSPGTDTGGGFRGGGDKGPKGPTGGGGKGLETFQMVNPNFKKSLFEDELRLENFIKKMELENRLKEEEEDQTVTRGEGIDISNIIRNVPEIKQRVSDTVSGIMSNPDTANLGTAKMFAVGGLADGNFDFENARQMYGLGKLVKKIGRTVKKIAKSPIGKAALLYAGTAGLGALGAGAARAGSGLGIFSPTNVFSNIVSSGKNLGLLKRITGVGKDGTEYLTRVGPLANLGIGSAIIGASALAGLLTPEQEEEAQELARGEGIDIEAARRSILNAGTAQDFRARRFVAEGGSMKEPVAKKTMPLLDMGGKEMDLREDGGFVPIGRMEKADDVPARLSKNEFVFTADAVRNAGDGDVDKGAEVMYNMMKNLEAGGDVSEESQGLEGARRMFQTSQRLEEVL